MAGFSREVARRIFVEELRRSDISFREGEDQNQYAPQYLLTPTGAKCNRIFIVGTMTEREDVGQVSGFLRARVSDPTGSIPVYAGQYQPEAARVLSEIEPPAFVAVVGKPSIYETEDGRKIISIRAESVEHADEATRNRWVLDAARLTIDRLNAMKAAGLKTEDMPREAFQSGDTYRPKSAAADSYIQQARMHYGTDIMEYRDMVLEALRSLLTSAMSADAAPALEYIQSKAASGEPESIRSRSNDLDFTAKSSEASVSMNPEMPIARIIEPDIPGSAGSADLNKQKSRLERRSLGKPPKTEVLRFSDNEEDEGDKKGISRKG